MSVNPMPHRNEHGAHSTDAPASRSRPGSGRATRRDEGHRRLDAMQPLDLDDLVYAASFVYERWAESAGCTLDLRIGSRLPVIEHERRRVRRIIDTIVHQTTTRAQGGSRIVIEARACSRGVEVVVAEVPAACVGDGTEPVFGEELLLAVGLAEVLGGSVVDGPRAGERVRFTFRLPATSAPSVHRYAQGA